MPERYAHAPGRTDSTSAGGVAAALATCVIVVTGCGGGGDDSTSTSANATVPQITSPGEFNPGGASTTTPDKPGGSSTAPGGPPGQSAPGLPPAQQALAPFRECLEQHGVSLPFLNGSGGQEQQREFQQNPQQYRAQVQKAFACIPKLPQQLRATAERFKQRFEEQQAPGSGGTDG